MDGSHTAINFALFDFFVLKQMQKSFSISNGFDTDFARGFAPCLENNDVILSQYSTSSKLAGMEEIMVRKLQRIDWKRKRTRPDKS